jgi:HK97 family phage prohead protease
MDNESKNIDIELKDNSGQVEAVFSLFNSLDSDGDVVVPGAVKSGFKNNQVPMVWSHKWDMPIGKGTIAQDDDKAVFKGEFFMDTESGKEAYNLVKNMGDMQQWSFGYKVNDSEFAKAKTQDGETNARYLKDLTVYEVSPVLVGANQDTYTLAIKSNTELLKEITSEKNGEEEVEVSSSCDCNCGSKGYGDDEQEKKSCKYHEGGSCMKMEEDKKEMKSEEDLEISEGSKPFSDEVKDVLAALDDLVARAKAIALLRGEDGRKLGVKATEALRAVADDLQDAWTEVDEFIGTIGTEGALELEVEEELVEDEPAETEEVAEASTDTIDVETEVEEVTEEEAPVDESAEEEPEDEAAEEETPEDNTDSSDEEFDAEWARAQQIIAESLVEEIEEV